MDWKAIARKVRTSWRLLGEIPEPEIEGLVNFSHAIRDYPPRIEIRFRFEVTDGRLREDYVYGYSFDPAPSDERMIAMGEYVAGLLENLPDFTAKRPILTQGDFLYEIKPKNYDVFERGL